MTATGMPGEPVRTAGSGVCPHVTWSPPAGRYRFVPPGEDAVDASGATGWTASAGGSEKSPLG